MKKLLLFCSLLVFPALLLLLTTTSCDVGSSESVYRNVDIYVFGFYANSTPSLNHGRVVATNTGSPIVSLDVRQDGDQLEAIDNNGQVFRGTIGQTFGSSPRSASFTLEGLTTVGNKGTISGTFEVNGSQGKMHGTWIESAMYSTVYGVATVAPSPTPQPTQITISGPTTITIPANATYTATGGSGSYTWSINNSAIGQLASTSGSSVVYSAKAAGTQILTVTDGQSTASVTITQN